LNRVFTFEYTDPDEVLRVVCPQPKQVTGEIVGSYYDHVTHQPWLLVYVSGNARLQHIPSHADIVPTMETQADRYDRTQLRHLVDVVWNEAHEDESVPDTEWADRMIDYAMGRRTQVAKTSSEQEAAKQHADEVNGRTHPCAHPNRGLEPCLLMNVAPYGSSRPVLVCATMDCPKMPRAL